MNCRKPTCNKSTPTARRQDWCLVRNICVEDIGPIFFNSEISGWAGMESVKQLDTIELTQNYGRHVGAVCHASVASKVLIISLRSQRICAIQIGRLQFSWFLFLNLLFLFFKDTVYADHLRIIARFCDVNRNIKHTSHNIWKHEVTVGVRFECTRSTLPKLILNELFLLAHWFFCKFISVLCN